MPTTTSRDDDKLHHLLMAWNDLTIDLAESLRALAAKTEARYPFDTAMVAARDALEWYDRGSWSRECPFHQ